MENEKYLFVVSGAAGTGKDSVVKALREAHPEIEKTVSATTRAPRPGEQEGVDYYYRTREQFQHLIDTDQVVEHNFYNGNYYGTLREEVDKRLEAGKLVVLVIDVHGAANIRAPRHRKEGAGRAGEVHPHPRERRGGRLR